MRLVFAGTPAFARTALEALFTAGHDIVLVVTQPDRPAGRGLKPKPSEVKALAAARGVRTYQPSSLRKAEAIAALKSTGGAAMVVAAYGLILPSTVLHLFPYGCINIHASLLPRWRGAAPIQRALLAGDSQTGISIMSMDEGLDTGPVLLQESISITPFDTAQTLHDRLAKLGGECIVRALEGLVAGAFKARAQPTEGVTYAPKIRKEEAELDWQRDAEALERQVRAFNPVPVASSHLHGQAVRVWQAQALEGESTVPGQVQWVEDNGIVVQCGHGLLRLLELQRAGGRRLPAGEFVRGFPVKAGERFGN